MREIVLDTETTGFDPSKGDRLVEIGCIELINHMATGERLHLYVNPERDMPEDAFRIHGLSADFLAGHPVFGEVAQSIIDFIADSPLVIHNAEFDMRFLNAEFARVGMGPLPPERAIDTVRMARKKFPGSPASLDALCKRFGIDNTARTLHGALLDAELLAEVYLELIGGREPGLSLVRGERVSAGAEAEYLERKRQRRRPTPLPSRVSAAEQAAHEAFIDTLSGTVLWREA